MGAVAAASNCVGAGRASRCTSRPPAVPPAGERALSIASAAVSEPRGALVSDQWPSLPMQIGIRS